MKCNFPNEINNNMIYNIEQSMKTKQKPREDRKYSTMLMKNCGFDPIFFNDIQKYVYVYEKNPMKKVYSSNAILAIPINEEDQQRRKQKKSYVAEDKESYEQEELNNILDNNILCINPKNQNQSLILNNKRMSAFTETPQLNTLVQNINNDVINNNRLINIYKSKIKTKFLKIYDTNSINIQGKIKYKLFHKCCYPGCNRTFSSSGWLKAHLKEHLKQIHNCQFSLLFKKFIYNDNKKYFDFVNKEKIENNNINNINKKAPFIIDKENN